MNSKFCQRFAFLHARNCFKRQTRCLWQPARLKRETPVLYYSLKERLEALDIRKKDPEHYEKVNIGFPIQDFNTQETAFKRNKEIEKIKADKALEKKARSRTLSVDLEAVEAEELTTTRVFIVHKVAEHLHIFKDLFGEFAYFHPVIPMNINYDFDSTTVSPVYMGNLLKPRETSTTPHVDIKDESDSLYTLVMTSPDGNLYEENAEVLHWFIGNIEGKSANDGEEVVPYLQPFPPHGTGFHRYVFVLYKQNERIDFDEYKQDSSSIGSNLRSRTFKTYDFYKKYESRLTPAGLSFFQADWDSSLTEFFHSKLNMREPSYEYDFPKPYITPQRFFPKFGKGFNNYLDLYRDPKDISKEILLKRLSKIHPFKGDLKLLPFPQAVKIDPELSIWIKNEIRAEREGSGKFKELYKGDNRPYQHSGPKTKRPSYPILNKTRFASLEED